MRRNLSAGVGGRIRRGFHPLLNTKLFSHSTSIKTWFIMSLMALILALSKVLAAQNAAVGYALHV